MTMRLEELLQSADGCFAVIRIRDEAAHGGARSHGISCVLPEGERLPEERLRDGLAVVMTKLVSRSLCAQHWPRDCLRVRYDCTPPDT